MAPSDYSFGARLLHRLALGSDAVAEASFDLQQGLDRAAIANADLRAPIFVAGLARAGTTILMRRIYGSGQFRSLTYRDMPFVLAPNLWARLSASSSRKSAARERAHGDGILVDFDSPEALEEVFWRVFCADQYIRPDRLVPMSADDETIGKFRGYVASILAPHPGQRYLSKNNNNILRLPALAEAFPDATILIPYRAPLQHALSLMKQHERFTGEHAENAFSQAYMTWLVHHEFGADQRPFVFSESPPAGDPARDLDYWLRLWLDAYAFIIANAPDQCVFVGYEQLCNNEAMWPGLCERLDISGTESAERFVLSKPDVDVGFSEQLATDAYSLYGELETRALRR